jgi:hypothetical protein
VCATGDVAFGRIFTFPITAVYQMEGLGGWESLHLPPHFAMPAAQSPSRKQPDLG